MAQWHWIEHPFDLQFWWERSPQWIGLDTEFIRERTYWPKLALVQMAIGDDVLIIDFQVEGMKEALRPWLTDPSLVKIMHSASEDCCALQHACNAAPAPLFDTQLAATLSGLGLMVSYQKLVAQLTGVSLTKGETRSDWQHRPLSAAQLHYAADDVRYLYPLYVALRSRLDQQQRMAWLDEDCQRLIAQAGQANHERWFQPDSRLGRGLDQAAQRRLGHLMFWREQHAQAVDLPRNWVIDSALAHQLAQSPPADFGALVHTLRAYPTAIQQLAQPLWQALSAPSDETTTPAATAIAPTEMTRMVKELQRIVAQQSLALNIPAAFLASRRYLEAIIIQRSWPSPLGYWRRVLLEKPLLQAVQRMHRVGSTSTLARD